MSPESFLAHTGFCGKRYGLDAWVVLGKTSHRLGENIAGHTVTLGGHDRMGSTSGGEELNQLAIAFLRRDISVHQGEAQ